MLERLYRWVDERTGIDYLYNALFKRKVPYGVGWLYTLDFATLFVFTLQVVTGAFLTVGLLLIFLAILLGVAVSGALYRWERQERAVPHEEVSPPASSATPPASPTASPASSTLSTTAPPPGQVSFAQDITPLFKKSCIICHGTIISGGLDLRSYEAIMNTGINKPLIIPGKPEESLFVGRLKEPPIMPPAGSLAPQEVQMIEAWIRDGAPNN